MFEPVDDCGDPGMLNPVTLLTQPGARTSEGCLVWGRDAEGPCSEQEHNSSCKLISRSSWSNMGCKVFDTLSFVKFSWKLTTTVRQNLLKLVTVINHFLKV